MSMGNAILFDCDGVLADTERYGHLVAFNRMWQALGVPWQWSDEQYQQKVLIGGGKERMRSLFRDDDFCAVYTPPADPAEQDALIAQWHQRKTAEYKAIINAGDVPPRPGIRRLILAALDAGWTCAMCSTSAVESVQAVLEAAVGADNAKRFAGIFAGDMVPAKKPAPDVYQLAVDKLQLNPANTLVVEDSRNGLLAATAAGLRCLVTVSSYTRHEDCSEAALVLSCLGDDSEPAEVLANPRNAPLTGGQVDLGTLEKLLS
jgi:HAD superfamily hydrolase (TIGR01509 family)